MRYDWSSLKTQINEKCHWWSSTTNIIWIELRNLRHNVQIDSMWWCSVKTQSTWSAIQVTHVNGRRISFLTEGMSEWDIGDGHKARHSSGSENRRSAWKRCCGRLPAEADKWVSLIREAQHPTKVSLRHEQRESSCVTSPRRDTDQLTEDSDKTALISHNQQSFVWALMIQNILSSKAVSYWILTPYLVLTWVISISS